ncbi:MAG: S41 family peptidase [Isosphaeraceae bacterium]|nr:S41 family peptidase [Isosphaeraceae bacterium]
MPDRRFFAFALIGATSLVTWQATQGAKPKDEMLELYGVFAEAVEQVEANYVRPVSRKELLETALQGMLQNLDPHSQFINTSEWKAFKRKIEGRFGGIGITVEMDPTGRPRVVAPMVGTPAYEAGILAGDLIVEIDGESTEGITPDKAVDALSGRPGTAVKLSVLHEGEEKPENITINRAIIDVPSVLGDVRKGNDDWDFMIDKDKKIAYIRISSFIQNTTEELKKALAELKSEGVKGLVLDLRDNPGGLLSSAVEVSDLFVDDGTIVSTKGRNTPKKTFEAHKEGNPNDYPIVVLINQGSASAAEIVSACLQDHKRAVIVGHRSFGKGSVQNIFDLDDGNSVLKLTVASYFRPSGKNIHRFKNAKKSDEWGVSPDEGMAVELTPEQYMAWARSRRDRDLESNAKGRRNKHEDAAKDKPKEDKPKEGKPGPDAKTGAAAKPGDTPAKEEARKKPFVDKQLDKALQVIREKLELATAKK